MADNENTKQEVVVKSHHKELLGKIVSDKMDKTVVVQVIRRYKHPLFKKYVSRRLKYKAHDETNQCHVGDDVIIQECRPISKQKRWRVKEITKKAL